MIEMYSKKDIVQMVMKALEKAEPEVLVDLATVVTGQDFEYEEQNEEFPFMCLDNDSIDNCHVDDDEESSQDAGFDY